MQLLLLFVEPFFQIIVEQSAELDSTVFSDLFAHNLAHLFKTLRAEDAGSVAFAAGKALLVYLRTAALETINLFFNGFLSRFLAVRHQNLAVGICIDLVNDGTVGLIGKSDSGLSVTTHFGSPDFNLAAGGSVFLTRVGVSIYEDHVLSNCGGVDLRNQITHIGSHVNCLLCDIVGADCHLVDHRLSLKGLVERNTCH